MCIIAAIKMGSAIPSLATLHNCFSSNPDGAGFMWAVDKAVYIRKGMMSWRAFRREWRAFLHTYVKDGKAPFPIVLHFRIGTSGADDGTMTHPFWLKEGTSAIVHNGILSPRIATPTQTESDTAVYAKNTLARLPLRWSEALADLIATHIGSFNKIVHLHKSGDMTIVNEKSGDWCGGVWYSNHGYQARPYYPPVKWESGSCYGLGAREKDWGYCSGGTKPSESIKPFTPSPTLKRWVTRDTVPDTHRWQYIPSLRLYVAYDPILRVVTHEAFTLTGMPWELEAGDQYNVDLIESEALSTPAAKDEPDEDELIILPSDLPSEDHGHAT